MKVLFVGTFIAFGCMAALGQESLGRLAQLPVTPVKHVVLITIDGMRGEMVNDAEMPSATLKMMKRGGLWVNRVRGIVPTLTYPSHTTIVTGALPCQHQVYYNTYFLGNRVSEQSYWMADSIKVPTIWERASISGLTCASLFWPVSTHSPYINWNVPEFWSVDMSVDQTAFLDQHCTPAGLLTELMQQATGNLEIKSNGNFWPGSINRDAKTAYMANYLMNVHRPNLMTIHLITTDYAQHATGKSSQRVLQAVESVDNAIATILENLEREKLMDSTVVLVMGDHGFANVHHFIQPNIWLINHKLLSQEPEGDWRCCFHPAGGMAYLYLKDQKDKKTVQRVNRIFAELPDSVRSLFKVYDHDALIRLGCDSKAALAIEPVEGYACSASRKGPALKVAQGGKHGYASGIDPTVMLAYGSGITAQTIDSISQTEIANYVMRLLGCTN